MRLMVSTHSFLLNIHLDDNLEVTSVDPIATGHHYGICQSDENKFDSFQTMTRAENAITTYTPEGEGFSTTYRKPPHEFDDLHQVSRQADGIYITSTGFNTINYLSDDENMLSWVIDDITDDINHVNSVFPFGSNKALFLLHNRAKRDSEVIAIQRTSDSLEPFARFPIWDTCCHNLYVDNHRMCYNSSGGGDFVVVNLDNQSVEKRMHFPGHTKGLAVTKDYFVIGYSEHVQREKRLTSRGMLVLIDRKSLTVKKVIDPNAGNLPHPVGNINEIRCISEPDFSYGTTKDMDVDWATLTLSKHDTLHQLVHRPMKIIRRKGLNLLRGMR
jgi:hypothetical protein